VLPKASCLSSDPGYPSYFGKGGDDEDGDLEEGFAPFKGGTAGVDADDSSYRLQPDFMKSFQIQGAQKAAGELLPAPNLNDSWKPLSPDLTTYTAYTHEGGEDPVGPGKADQAWALSFLEPQQPLPPKGTVPPRTRAMARPSARELEQRVGEEKMVREIGAVVPAGGNPKEDKDLLLARIDALMGRIEMLEQKKGGQDTQQELLLFIGGGLALLLSFQLIAGGGR
jgi:hypothetical protein